MPQQTATSAHESPDAKKPVLEGFARAATDQAIRLLIGAVGILPRPWGLRAGAFLGRLVFALDRRHRDVAMDNLRNAYGAEMTPEAVRETARRVFENFGKVLFEVCWAWRLDDRKLLRHFRVYGLDHMRRACRRNRGVLALTGHFGNWELLSTVVAWLDRPISIVYRPLDFTPLSRFIEAFRRRFGAELIHRRKAIRRILAVLGEGGIVAVLLDQSVDWYEGVFVDFFGRRACTNQAMARLALKTGAPVIPVFLIRNDDGFAATFLPEIPLIRTGDPIKDVEMNTENYNRAIESVIRSHPEQWFWVHRRWKIRPYETWQGVLPS
jgi:KDO2-lipid IV(A) lauroyltransferase